MIHVPFADKTLVMNQGEARSLIQALQEQLGILQAVNGSQEVRDGFDPVITHETEHMRLRRLGVIGPGRVRTGGGGRREMTAWERDMWERGYEITS